MTVPESRKRIFYTAVRLIGNICERSLSLRAIDHLFTHNGADLAWKATAPYPHPSEKQRQVYYWLYGIETYTPAQTLPTIYAVLSELADSASIFRHEDKIVARNLLHRIDAFTGQRSDYQWHPSVMAASGKLFADGHYKEAAREAIVALIAAVREKAGNADGQDKHAMIEAFRKDTGFLRISDDPNEQEGYQQLFTGAVSVIRNPLLHVAGSAIDAHEEIEYLTVASLLFRALDRAQLTR